MSNTFISALLIAVTLVNDKFIRANEVEWSEDTARNEDDDEDTNSFEPDAQAKLGLQTQRYSPRTIAMMNLLDERQIPYELIVHIMERLCDDRSLSHLSSAFLIFMPGLAEIRRLNDILVEHPFLGSDAFRIFPLHSTISSENQNLVFDIPPPGIRKIVIGSYYYCCVTSGDLTIMQPLTSLRLAYDTLIVYSRTIELIAYR